MTEESMLHYCKGRDEKVIVKLSKDDKAPPSSSVALAKEGFAFKRGFIALNLLRATVDAVHKKH